ncbi:hypothetical protein Tco_1134949, partial [Tanacetum coccineum]
MSPRSRCVGSIQMKLAHHPEQDTNRFFHYEKGMSRKGVRFGEAVRNNRFKIWSGIATRDHVEWDGPSLPHEGHQTQVGLLRRGLKPYSWPSILKNQILAIDLVLGVWIAKLATLWWKGKGREGEGRSWWNWVYRLRQQLQGKDDTIRNLDAQINIMKVLNVGSTASSCDQQVQLKDTITSLRIQLDGLKVENVSLKRQYDELSQANTHSRTAYTEKLSALTAGNNQLKAQVNGKTSSGPSTSETPKVLAPGMYNLGSKYIPPPKRANWVKPTPLPKKRQVTFSEPPRPSLKPTQKPVVHPNKQTNVCVPMSKRAPRNHSSLPAKSANARRVEAHHRTLNKKNRVDSNLLVKHSVSVPNLRTVCGGCNKSLVFANHNDCLVMCDDSVNVKPHQTKRLKRQPKKEWKPIKNVGKPIKRVWKSISKPVASSKPQWKPTGRHF